MTSMIHLFLNLCRIIKKTMSVLKIFFIRSDPITIFIITYTYLAVLFCNMSWFRLKQRKELFDPLKYPFFGIRVNPWVSPKGQHNFTSFLMISDTYPTISFSNL